MPAEDIYHKWPQTNPRSFKVTVLETRYPNSTNKFFSLSFKTLFNKSQLKTKPTSITSKWSILGPNKIQN